jgi:hypothetical protein
MICPHCKQKIEEPVAAVLQLRCSECDGVLLELDVVLSPEQLQRFLPVAQKAMEERDFFEALIRDPWETLRGEKIEEEAIEELVVTLSAVEISKLRPGFLT